MLTYCPLTNALTLSMNIYIYEIIVNAPQVWDASYPYTSLVGNGLKIMAATNLGFSPYQLIEVQVSVWTAIGVELRMLINY